MAMRPRGGGAGPNRPGRTTTVCPVYETFTPVFQRQQDEEAEKLLIYLPGFLKENIRVSTEGKTTLKVRGERLIGSNKWNRFVEEFQTPEDCKMGGIHARFENGILTITMPITKKIPPPEQKQQEETPPYPYIPPFLRTTKDDHSPPPLAPQTPPHIQNQQPLQPKLDFPPNISHPIQPKPLKGDQDEDSDNDDFATKSVGSSVERQKQATPLKGDGRDEEDSQKETTPKVTDGENFPDKTSQFSSTVESQKKAALGPMFPKDNQDELSPPKGAPSVFVGAKQGDHQKSLEDQEKVTGDGQKMKPLIGLKDFVEGEKSSEVKGKGTITQTFDGRNKTSSIAEKERREIDKDDQKKQGFKGGFTDPKEERQLLVNAGVAVLVILALGAYIYNTVGTRKSD